MLHDHESMTNSEFQHEHSLVFHKGIQVSEIEGLHWHLAFPRDVTGEQEPARDEVAPDSSLFACASAAASSESVSTAWLLSNLQSLTVHFNLVETMAGNDIQIAAESPESFLQMLLSELPLSSVTGVCLI